MPWHADTAPPAPLLARPRVLVGRDSDGPVPAKTSRREALAGEKGRMDLGMNWPRMRWVIIAVLISLAAVFGLYEMTKAINNSG